MSTYNSCSVRSAALTEKGENNKRLHTILKASLTRSEYAARVFLLVTHAEQWKTDYKLF